MLSGRRTLSNIDQTLQTVRNETVRLDQQLSTLVGQVTMSQRHRLTLLKQIAEVRLDEIESGRLSAEFDAADAQVARLLQEREQALETLFADIERVNRDIGDGESKRENLLAQYNAQSEKLVDVESQVQAELKLSTDYLEQYNKAQQAESVSEEADAKMERAQSDMAKKAEPYQADPLFMYLWQRGFGTTAYSGGLLSRFIDGWVARLIKYEPARVNFWNLNEIPKRLSQHADRVAELADQALRGLEAIEQNALKNAGLEQLESVLEAHRSTLDEHDDYIERLESDLNDFLAQRALYSSGGDEFTRQCLDRITGALQHQSLGMIDRYVRQTHSPQDDRVVLELQELEDNIESAKGDMASVRKLHDKQVMRLRELENVRQQFKNSRFDDVRSGFVNEALITSVLSQFLQGVISGADVWGTIKRNQRYRNVGASPDFGSGGLGDIADVLAGGGVDLGDILRPKGPRRHRRRRGSSWHIPKPRRNGGGFQFPRSTGRRGGGFKTGGGF